MRAQQVIGILLIVAGVFSFIYQGISYTTHKKVIDLGPVEAVSEQHKTIPIRPIIGGLALVGGVLLLTMSGRRVV